MVRRMRIGMVVTDLDGTLLDSNHRLADANRRTLLELGELGIVRVVATGRSLFSARRVLDAEVPIDYLAHSSGAGITSWPTERELCAHQLPSPAAERIVRELVARRLDFMLHRAIPDNHSFYAHRAGMQNSDFDERIRRFADYAHELRLPFVAGEAMGHVIVVEPPTAESCYLELCAALAEYQVIRSTSPLDGSSTWIEVYPAGVSKASAAAWIVGQATNERGASIAIGNDYNDLELLNWADQAFVVANAPAELRARYTTVASNDAGGFSEAVRRALG